jgi:hypothetical protein
METIEQSEESFVLQGEKKELSIYKQFHALFPKGLYLPIKHGRSIKVMVCLFLYDFFPLPNF